jgi:hypothetical protein
MLFFVYISAITVTAFADELTTFLDEEDQWGVLEAVRRVVGGGDGITALWVSGACR